MSIVAIIQARMGSTRLPGKVLLDIGGATMLARTVHRTRQAALVDAVVVATSTGAQDDAIQSAAFALGVQVFRGSEADVLDRYYQAAQASEATVVVRVTSDCPLIAPDIIDEVVRSFLSGNSQYDYASNFIERRHPRGLDVEVFSVEALASAWRSASSAFERAHVTPYIYLNPDKYRLLSVPAAEDNSHHRWTVDTPEDLALVRAIYARLNNDDSVSWRRVLKLVSESPALMALNSAIQQKGLREG